MTIGKPHLTDCDRQVPGRSGKGDLRKPVSSGRPRSTATLPNGSNARRCRDGKPRSPARTTAETGTTPCSAPLRILPDSGATSRTDPHRYGESARWRLRIRIRRTDERVKGEKTAFAATSDKPQFDAGCGAATAAERLPRQRTDVPFFMLLRSSSGKRPRRIARPAAKTRPARNAGISDVCPPEQLRKEMAAFREARPTARPYRISRLVAESGKTMAGVNVLASSKSIMA